MVIVAVIFLAIILAAVLGNQAFGFFKPAIDSANTTNAANQLAALNTIAETYSNDHGSPPPAAFYQSAGPYVQSVPSDPSDQGHGADYTVAAYTTPGELGWVIVDTFIHPAQTLAKLPKYDGTPGDPPSGACGDTGCTKMVYDSNLGLMGE